MHPAALEAVLSLIRCRRGLDLSEYRRSSLLRTISRRMRVGGFRDFAEYRAALEAYEDELDRLVHDVLNRTTGFFRDASAWTTLARKVLANWKQRRAQLRIWSAGCASGEEVWTAAILLNEVLGEDTYRNRVSIVATDVDRAALQCIREACYSAAAVADVPEPLRSRYFLRDGARYRVVDRLRHAVSLAKHDLLHDPPVPGIDLLICRNTMIYFTDPARVTLLVRLHHVISEAGLLFLGNTELPLAAQPLFVPVDLRARIFLRNSRCRLRVAQARSGVPAFGAHRRCDEPDAISPDYPRNSVLCAT